MCFKCRALASETVTKAIVLQTTGEVYIGPVKVYPCIEPEEPTIWCQHRELTTASLGTLGDLAELFGVGITVRKGDEA